MTLTDCIRSFIGKWKIASTAMLYERAFPSPISAGGLKVSLHRLRQNGEILSCRIGNQSYHFHPIYRRRFEVLQSLPVGARWMRANKWGFAHHLETTKFGFQFEKLFPLFSISTNVFSDYVSFAEGTGYNGNHRYCPDISLSYSKGELRRFIYVEYEKHSKTKEKYTKRWIAYHNEPKLRSCLYITDDPNLEHRLEQMIETYMRTTRQRPNFSMAVMEPVRPNELTPQTQVKELGKGLNRSLSLDEFVNSDMIPSRNRPNFSNKTFLNQYEPLDACVGLTTLSLPSSTSLEVPNGNEKVVNPTPVDIENNHQDGREKFGRFGTEWDHRENPGKY